MEYSELNERQKEQLANDYMVRLVNEGTFAEVMGVDYDEPSCWDVANALELVPDDVLEREYGDILFTDDDFF